MLSSCVFYINKFFLKRDLKFKRLKTVFGMKKEQVIRARKGTIKWARKLNRLGTCS